jgi:hypothetical protein
MNEPMNRNQALRVLDELNQRPLKATLEGWPRTDETVAYAVKTDGQFDPPTIRWLCDLAEEVGCSVEWVGAQTYPHSNCVRFF